MNVLKGEMATKKYGEQGKNGVIEITTIEKPLYNIDGTIIKDPSFIEPNTIESINVLKGANGYKRIMEKKVKTG